MPARKPFHFQVTESSCFVVDSLHDNGRGYIRLKHEGSYRGVHQITWEECFGPIPPGMCVCHKCDNRACINPEHLFLGTDSDNKRDCVAKNRQARGATHGRTKLTIDSVRHIRDIYKPRIYTIRRISREFGVGYTTVRHILTRKNWRWLV